MPNFNYSAKTGDNRIQKGIITANDRASALKSLSEKHLSPILVREIGPKKGTINFSKIPFLKPRVKSKDLVIMTRQMSTMINAGVPIIRVLQTLQDQTESKALQATLVKVVSSVEDGAALSDALAKHPKVFSVVFVNMVKAGETGGILDQILERLAFQVEKDHEIKGKVKGAMIYPSVITFITFAAFIFLMTGIVPRLQSIFDEFGSELPLNTRIMLSISNALLHHGVLVGAITAGAIFLLVRYFRTKGGKKKFDRLILKLPLFGQIILKVNVARFARTFSSLAGAGVSVLDGLNVTAHALKNVIIRDGIIGASEKVRNGEPISISLEQAKIFPPIVTQMVAVGEETGQVDKVLTKVADFYEKEVDRVIANLTSIIEPLLIIFLGGLVGLIISSVFGPISNLSNIVE